MSPDAPRFSNLPYRPVTAVYELLEERLEGEAAVITQARERGTRRLVGIERPLPELAADTRFAHRFRDLLATTSGLSHPNLLKVYDVAVDDQSVYGVVEWPERGSLARRLQEGPLDEAELRALARGGASALRYLEERGLTAPRLSVDRMFLGVDGALRLPGAEHGSASASRANAAAVVELCQVLKALAPAAPAWLDDLLVRGLAGDARLRFRDAAEFQFVLERRLAECDGADALRTRQDTIAPDSPGRRDGNDADAEDDAFPWRPVSELFRLQGTPVNGGMGMVQRAQELGTGRTVAIKRVHAYLLDHGDARQRFRREALTISRLNHPHILQVLQVGRDEQGDYLVLEWAPGGSLAQRLQAHGALPLPEVLAIARQVGGALAYAHAKGCVHRDVKPHNILLAETGEPKLADFGLARSSADATLTSSSARAGSPAYMAPEQAGFAREADARSDLYAFAKTLYHLATGQLPTTVLKEALPRVLRQPVLRALAYEPAMRHASIGEFLEDLERCAARRRHVRLAGLISIGAIVLALLSAWAALKVQQRVGPEESAGPSQALARPDPVAPADEQPVAPWPPELPADRTIEAGPEDRASVGEPTPPVDGQEALGDPGAPGAAGGADPTDLLLPLDAANGRGADPSATADPVGSSPSSAAADLSGTAPGEIPPGEGKEGERPAGAGAGPAGAAQGEADPVAPPPDPRPGSEVTQPKPLDPDAEPAGGTVEASEGIGADSAASKDPAPQADARPESKPPAPSEAQPSTPSADPGKGRVEPPSADRPKPQPPVDPVAQIPGLRALGIHPDGRAEYLVVASGDEPAGDSPHPRQGIVLVSLPGGRYKLGFDQGQENGGTYAPAREEVVSAALGDVHAELKPFLIAKHELTEYQWLRLIDRLPEKDRLLRQHWRLRDNQDRLLREGSLRPIVDVTWRDAVLVLKAHGLTLPTEAQWEFACRGASRDLWAYGNQFDDVCAASNLLPRAGARGEVRDIAGGRANRHGLFDMHGNVQEWCLDPWVDWGTGFIDRATGLRRPARDAAAGGVARIRRIVKGGNFSALRQSRTCDRVASFEDRNPPPHTGVRPARLLAP